MEPHLNPRSILRLSNEVLRIIAEHMDTPTVAQFGTTCIRLREIVETELWRSLTIVFEQLPLVRTTRMRVEQNKTTAFATFCRQPENQRLFERVAHLRISIPMEMEVHPTKLFDKDVTWFCDNLLTLFPNVRLLELFSVATVQDPNAADKTKRNLNQLLALPVTKRVEIEFPLDSALFPPLSAITQCEYIKCLYPVSIELDRVLPYENLEQCQSLEIGCQAQANPATEFITINAQLQKDVTLNKCLQLRKLKLSRAQINFVSTPDWLPPNLEHLECMNVTFVEGQGQHELFEPYVVPSVRFFKLVKTGLDQPIAADNPFKGNRLSFPNLEFFETNGHCVEVLQSLGDKLKHIKFNGTWERALAVLQKIDHCKSFEIFLGHIGERTSYEMLQLAKQVQDSPIEALAMCVLPPYAMNPNGNNAFGMYVPKGYKPLRDMLVTLVTHASRISDVYLIEPAGLEQEGLQAKWITRPEVSTPYLERYEDSPAAVDEWFKVDVAQFKETVIERPDAISSAPPPPTLLSSASRAIGTITVNTYR